MIRAANLVAHALEQVGVQTIFAMSGNQLMPLFDALFDHQFQLVHIRHEAAAVHMADAWARLKGTPGIALIPAGPGFANGLSASYSAVMAESPVVVISGHCPLSQVGKGGFQEMRQAEIAGHFAKDSWTVERADNLAPSIVRAYELAQSGRPGPVHVSMPFDLLNAQIEPGEFSHEVGSDRLVITSLIAESILDSLNESERPLIVTGPLLNQPHNRVLKSSLEKATGIPVVAMESHRGVNDPSLGDLTAILKEADIVLLLGKIVDFSLQFGSALSGQCRILSLDPDPHQLKRVKNIFQDRVLVSAPAEIPGASRILIAAANRNEVVKLKEGWVNRVSSHLSHRPHEWQELGGRDHSPMHPLQVCEVVEKIVSGLEDVILVVDGGEFGQWVQAGIKNRCRIINGLSGSIGSSLPFAIAAQLAEPRARVFVFMGDGTAGFHLSEFDTAVRTGSPIIAIIGNDAKWNAEHQIQLRDYGRERTFACELLPTRYDVAAGAFGCYSAKADNRSELETGLNLALKSGMPSCINVDLNGQAAPVIRKNA